MIPDGERLLTEVVWENIEKYRKEKKLSVTDLCKKVGYTSSNYIKNRREKGQIMPNTIQKFAGVLGVKTIDLIEDWSE